MKIYMEKIYRKSKKEYFEHLKKRIEQEKRTFIVTANPEILMIGEQDKEFNNILIEQDVEIVADGIGVVKGAKLFGIEIPERITGVELSQELIKYCNENNKSMYLFGAKPEVIEKMKDKFKQEYPNIRLLGAENGYVKDKQKVMEEIAKTNADVILIALGVPLQEKLIYKNLEKFNKGILIGVGGSFDVISNSVKRAPKIFIKLNLEWLYRIAFSPARWKRFYEGNIKYIFKLKKEVKKEKEKGRR